MGYLRSEQLLTRKVLKSRRMMNKPRIKQSGRKDLGKVAVPGFGNNLMQRERRLSLGRLTSVWFRSPGKVW